MESDPVRLDPHAGQGDVRRRIVRRRLLRVRPPERAEDDAGFRQIPAAARRTALREVTERILPRGGYRVLAAANGAEAMTTLRPGIRVLFMSGYAQPVLTTPPNCCRHCTGRPPDGEARQAFRRCIARSSRVAPAAHSSVPAAVVKRIAMAGSAGSNATAPGMPAAAWKGNATR